MNHSGGMKGKISFFSDHDDDDDDLMTKLQEEKRKQTIINHLNVNLFLYCLVHMCR